MITLSLITLSGFHSTKIIIKSRLITAEALSKFLDDIIDFAFNLKLDDFIDFANTIFLRMISVFCSKFVFWN